jgi:hypothetical protein
LVGWLVGWLVILLSTVTKWLSMTSFRQRTIIEFHVKENNSAADIYRQLSRVYGDACMCASSVRNSLKNGNMGIADQPRCGWLIMP